MFNNRARNGEAFWLTFRVIMGMTFVHAVAFFANEKFCQMTMRTIAVVMGVIMKMIMITSNKSIERFDAVDQPVAR